MSISVLNTAISALDTPSSLLPFFVKDAFDVTGRTLMAQSEGGKHEAREKFIEEAGTSLFWIAGIPAIRAISKKIFKTKLDTDIHFKRINTQGPQNYFAKNLEGIELGGERLKQIQKKLTGENLKKYKNYHIRTTTASVLINLFMLTVALPKFNQFLSRKIISKEVNANKNKQNELSFDNLEFGTNKNGTSKSKNQSFGALKDLLKIKDLFNFTQMAENAQLNVQSSMLILDYGISGSRVSFIPRNNNERVEYVIKEGGIILFFYYAADLIKKGLANLANKYMKTPINLDYKIIQSKEFLERLKKPHNKEELLKFAQTSEKDEKSEIKIIKFIDEQLGEQLGKQLQEQLGEQHAKTSKNNKINYVFDNFTLQMAQKEGLIQVEYDQELGKWIRHSKKYIETDKLLKLNENLRNFYDTAFTKIKINPSTTLENIISKTKKVKIASIVANMAICCASLSFILPKIQYTIREHRTQTKAAPGIKLYQELAQKNQLKV